MSLYMKLCLSCLLSSLVGTGGTQSPRNLATSPVRSAEEAWITPAPQLHPRDVETWGFVSGNSSKSLTLQVALH